MSVDVMTPEEMLKLPPNELANLARTNPVLVHRTLSMMSQGTAGIVLAKTGMDAESVKNYFIERGREKDKGVAEAPVRSKERHDVHVGDSHAQSGNNPFEVMSLREKMHGMDDHRMTSFLVDYFSRGGSFETAAKAVGVSQGEIEKRKVVDEKIKEGVSSEENRQEIKNTLSSLGAETSPKVVEAVEKVQLALAKINAAFGESKDVKNTKMGQKVNDASFVSERDGFGPLYKEIEKRFGEDLAVKIIQAGSSGSLVKNVANVATENATENKLLASQNKPTHAKTFVDDVAKVPVEKANSFGANFAKGAALVAASHGVQNVVLKVAATPVSPTSENKPTL